MLIHAAAAEDNGRGLIFPASMEAGKTTLVAGLVQAGLRYLTDEAVAIAPVSLCVRGLAKPLTIEHGSWEVLADLKPDVPASVRHYAGSQWHVDVRTIRPDALAVSATPSLVIVPRYERGATTALTPLRRPLALMALCENAFNLTERGQVGLDVLGETVRRSECYRLVVGDLKAACALVLDVLAGSVVPPDATPLERSTPPSSVASVEIEGESVLLDTTGALHHLDAIGTLIWACCDGSSSMDELAVDLANAFNVDRKRARRDVTAFVRTLVSRGLLTPAEGARGPARPVASG